jgi:hypothetical protein
MRPLLPVLAAAVLSMSSLAAHAGSRPAAKPRLTKTVRKEVKRDAASLMGWSMRLFSGRNPRLRTTFTPTDRRNQFEVTADLVARWRGERSVQASRSGIIELQPGGQWTWKATDGSPNRDLYGPRDPAASVSARENRVDNAAVVRRARGKAFVIYSATDRGNELRIATIDTRNGRPLATSKNLAGPAMRTAVEALARRGALTPNNVVLGPLSRGGRSVEVTIYYPLNSGGATAYARTVRVGLDSQGRPTGAVRQVEFRHIDP